MECLKCGSQKLKAYNFDDLNYIFYYVNNNWVISDPKLKTLFYSSRKNFNIKCLNCFHEWNNNIKEALSPLINHKEITLDIDHTLCHITEDRYYDNPKIDYKFKHPKLNYDFFYSLTKRPYLNDFLKYCIKNFDKINIYSAAQDWYVEEVLSFLKIPKEKLGYVKNFSHTEYKRPLSFHKENVKFIDNSLVIDDKSLVIEGYNNIVYPIKKFNAYEFPSKDKELLKLINILKKEQFNLSIPKKANCEIELFLRNMIIKTKKIPIDIIKNIIKEIKPITETEMELYPVRTQLYDPYFIIKNNKAYLSFPDLNYKEYSKLLDLIKPFIKDQKVNKKDFDSLIQKRKIF